MARSATQNAPSTNDEANVPEPEAVQPEPEAPVLSNEQREALEAVGTDRVRLSFEDRKMSVPGRIHKMQDGGLELHTNWGLVLPLAGETITKIETRDPDSGRYISA